MKGGYNRISGGVKVKSSRKYIPGEEANFASIICENTAQNDLI